MSIASFADLRTQIASWLNRTDLTAAQLGQFVAATEDDIRNDLECRESVQRTSGTLTADGFTAPLGYLSTRTLVIDGELSEYLPPDAYARKSDENSTGNYYTINGDDFSVLNGNGKSVELLYVATIASLVDDADTNWILENASNIYLWGGCKYGSVFLRDMNGATGYAALYDRAMAQLNRKERDAKYSGPMMVRAA